METIEQICKRSKDPQEEVQLDNAITHLAAAGLIGQARLLTNYPGRDALEVARKGAVDRLEWMGGVFKEEAYLAIGAIDLLIETQFNKQVARIDEAGDQMTRAIDKL